MAAETAIPFLRAVMLIAAMRVVDMRDEMAQALPFFRRRRVLTDKIAIRKNTRRGSRVHHVDIDAQATPVARGTWDEIEYSPTWIKLFDTLTVSDWTLFTRAAEAATQNGQDVRTSMHPVIVAARERVNDIATALRQDNRAERDMLCIGALLGSVSYREAHKSTDTTIDYGLNSLTSDRGASWATASTKIVSSMYDILEAFQNNNSRGVRATHAFYKKSLWRDFLAGNTEWKEYEKANPALAAGFLTLRGGQRMRASDGALTDPIFDLTWVPIEGQYNTLAGAATDKWGDTKLTLANLAYAQPTWASIRTDQYTPNEDFNVEVQNENQGGAKVTNVYLYDNGLPMFMEPDMVQTLDLIA